MNKIQADFKRKKTKIPPPEPNEGSPAEEQQDEDKITNFLDTCDRDELEQVISAAQDRLDQEEETPAEGSSEETE